MHRFLVVLLLGAGPRALAQDPPVAASSVLDEATRATWMVRIARMEGASVDVEEAARAVAQAARGIAASGEARDVAVLSGSAAELRRKVISATLAAQVLTEP